MIKHLAAGVIAFGLLGGTAMAQTPPLQEPSPAQSAPAAPPAAATATSEAAALPQNPDECMKSAVELAEATEGRALAEDKLDKVDDLLLKMEQHCDAKQFGEAMAIARDIKALIDTQ